MKFSAGISAKGVGGFLRYVQYRDQHEREELARDVKGLVRYVAYRDQASPQGRLFDKTRTVGDRERKALVRHVQRSQERDSRGKAAQRSVYRMVLSPENARGLDLRRVAREAMAQLERDLGAELPPWVAAEHRNTAHPHVHIVMAARREIAPGRYRTLVITRQRLGRMKEAMTREIQRERGELELKPRSPRLERQLDELSRDGGRERRRERAAQGLPARDPERERSRLRRSLSRSLSHYLDGLARNYLREAEREAELQRWASREREREQGRERD